MVVFNVGYWFWTLLCGCHLQYEGIARSRIRVANCFEPHCNRIGHVAHCLVEWSFNANRLDVDLARRNWDVSNGIALPSFCSRIANDTKSSRVPHYPARTSTATRMGPLYA